MVPSSNGVTTKCRCRLKEGHNPLKVKMWFRDPSSIQLIKYSREFSIQSQEKIDYIN